MNATIQRALGKLVNSKPNTWDQYLDAVMFGLRTKKQITTKHSPFFLMFGREARYPSEIPEHYQVGTEVEEVVAEEEVFSGIKQQEKIFQVLRKQNVDAAEKRKQDSREKIQCTYNTGDLVWRQNVRSQQRKGGKLDPDFLGPFTVTKVEGKSADLVDSCGKVLPKVSIDHLKPYIEEMPRIPRKIKANRKAHHITTASTTLSASAATIPASTTTNASTISSASTTINASTTSSTTDASMTSSTSTTTDASTTSSATITTNASTTSSASITINASTTSSTFTTTNASTTSSNATTTNASMTSSATTTTLASNISHDTIESYIRDAWNGKAPHVLVSRIGPYAVFFGDIARTAPNQELEDSVMNSYLLILARRYNETHLEEALSIDSFEMSQIWKNEKTKLK
ncbi:putative gypsy retrotransposon integrase-like protein 1-like, partial [Triplophysa rosa]